jgi:steroid delta-isomerase-like uncharacterized protein
MRERDACPSCSQVHAFTLRQAPAVTAMPPLATILPPPVTNRVPARAGFKTIPGTQFRVRDPIMKTCNVLLSAVATWFVFSCAVPSWADATGHGRAESLELNKSVTRRVYEEGLNQGRFDVPYTDDFVGHGGNATFTHADGMAEARGWREAFPDLRITVDQQVAERDLVAVRWTARGTNTGTGNGIPATGRAVQINGTTLFRMDEGRIAEEWTCANSLGLMKQLGLLETTAAVPSAGNRAAAAADQ